MGALVAVAYLVLHGRFNIRPRNLVCMIAGFGFLGVYLLPFGPGPGLGPGALGQRRRCLFHGRLLRGAVTDQPDCSRSQDQGLGHVADDGVPYGPEFSSTHRRTDGRLDTQGGGCRWSAKMNRTRSQSGVPEGHRAVTAP